MKLWMRFYIIAFVLIMLALGLCTYLVLTQSIQREIDREVQRGLDSHYSVCSALLASTAASALYSQETGDRQTAIINYAVNNYAHYYAGKDVFLAVTANGKLVYNNAPFSPMDHISSTGDSTRQYIITHLGDRDMLLVAGDTTLLGSMYTVYYMQDISKVFSDGTLLARGVAWVDLVVLALLGVALFISVWLAVRPLKSLQKATRAMAGGTYDLRIPIKSDDEIGELAKDFNLMTQAVEVHVSQLKATADDRRMLIANMTHELKTPMTSIIGYSEILLRARLDPKQQELALRHIHGESLRIEALSQKLMRLVALEGEKLDVREEDVSELFDTVKNAVEMLLTQNSQALTTSCELQTLDMDKDLMTGLLTNLIDNARKASPEGSTIELSAFLSPEGYPVLQVKDNGHGIPADELPKVMEPFYMVDKQRSRRSNSAGLGLSLCAIIAQVHHAHIKIMSTVDVGTTVQVIFGGEAELVPKARQVRANARARDRGRGRSVAMQRARQISRGKPVRLN